MADITLVKISALPAAEQIGAEDLLPVVQEGATKAIAYGVIKDDIAEELAPDATLSEAGKAADAKAVGDALALKADKTELTAEVSRIDAALNTKVNNTTYTAEVERIDGAIATKADAAATTAALATKANANDVTAALALKADTATVNASLATKANTSTVNAALALKADKTELTAGLATKQDALTFDSAPTEGSTNPVTSGGVWEAIQTDKTLAVEDKAADAKITGDAIKSLTNKVSESIAELKGALDIWGLRGANDGKYQEVTLPTMDHLADISISLLSDGYKFIPICDLTKNKNQSANEVTVSTTDELTAAIAAATNGDTIYLNEGAYSAFEVNKPLNLIGKGAVIIERIVSGGYEETATAGVWRSKTLIATKPSAAYQVIDGQYIQLREVGTTTGVAKYLGSFYYTSSGRTYVHLYEEEVPTELNVVFNNGTDAVIKSETPTANGTIYLENITIFGGKYNISVVADASYSDRRIVAVDCKFICAWNNNNVRLYGADGLFQRCESNLSYHDGFNYHADTTNGIISNGLEIDCIGHDNGREEGLTSPSHNGSTIHDGGKIIRINGLYYNNNGGNVADASADTESYNYGCVAYDSKAPQDEGNTDQTSADYWVKTGAIMYLYGCRAIGDSQYNLRTDNGVNAIHVSKCEYIRTTGNIVVDG